MKKLLALFLCLSLLLSGCYVVIEVPEEPVSGSLQVHFLDVGQADAILVECGNEYVLIDGGNREDSDLVVSYLEQQGVQQLQAVVCTHAHEDHVGGLPGVLSVFPTAAVYAPTDTYSSNIFDKFLYYVDQQGLSVTIPAPGDSFMLGDAQFTVLGPVKAYPDANNTSIILRLDYGQTAFLFTGDMEKDAESDMLDYWEGQVDWRADVLKMGHHGSDTSSSYRFLNEVMPSHAVIPVGQGNDYGHPHREPMERLRQAGILALRTDKLGHIIAYSDGSAVEFTWENQNASPEDAEVAGSFIGNKNSKVFHLDSCGSLPAEKNRVPFDSYDDALQAGYSPCTGCLG